METLSVTFAGDPQTYHVITNCNESDTCPGCGAGYKAGFIECEYCRRPVRFFGGREDDPVFSRLLDEWLLSSNGFWPAQDLDGEVTFMGRPFTQRELVARRYVLIKKRDREVCPA